MGEGRLGEEENGELKVKEREEQGRTGREGGRREGGVNIASEGRRRVAHPPVIPDQRVSSPLSKILVYPSHKLQVNFGHHRVGEGYRKSIHPPFHLLPLSIFTYIYLRIYQ